MKLRSAIGVSLITCVFTEPFLRTDHDSVMKTVHYASIESGIQKPAQAVEMFTDRPGLVVSYGQIDGKYFRHVIDLESGGNDGQSACQYPFRGRLYWNELRPHEGGCYSIERPKVCQTKENLGKNLSLHDKIQ